jgi:thiamine-monophosphate kinase
MSDHPEPDEVLEDEEAVVRLFEPLARAAGAFALKDDCAILQPRSGTDLVLKTDPIAEGVHFLPDAAPADVGWKALAVNVSDLAAKGAIPSAYLLALSFPSPPRRGWVLAFAEGLRQAQEAFGCQLLGGDTDRRPGPITVAITAIGSVPRGRMVRRATARVGDSLFVSGTLGDAALGLQLAKDATRASAWGLSPAMARHLCARYHRPQPRLALAGALRAHASAAMDLSDGLAKDLGRMCKASGCGARVRLADLPLSGAAQNAVDAEARQYKSVLAAGDDYEILASIPPSKEAAFRAAAAAAGVAIALIGHTTAGSGVAFTGFDGETLELTGTGWDHFAAGRGDGPGSNGGGTSAV